MQSADSMPVPPEHPCWLTNQMHKRQWSVPAHQATRHTAPSSAPAQACPQPVTAAHMCTQSLKVPLCPAVLCCAALQVDLSDDYVLFMMFADGQWENDMTPIEFEEDGGQTKQLTMTEKEFHEVCDRLLGVK